MQVLSITLITHWRKFVHSNFGNVPEKIVKLHGKIIYTFVNLGGSKSFTKLVEEANLISPFEEGCVESVIGTIEDYLNSVNDAAL